MPPQSRFGFNRGKRPQIRRFGRHVAIAAVICAVLFAAIEFVAYTELSRRTQNQRAEITDLLGNLRTRLGAEVNTNVFLANGLAVHIIAVEQIDDDRMTVALGTLHRLGRHIRNIGLAPDNRITVIYPLRGNEAALGFYYPDSETQWPAVERAISTRRTIMAGPVPLVQGGNGLITRTPVWLLDGRYWGIISLVLDSDSLFQSVGLLPEIDGVRYALRGRDGLGDAGEMILGDAAVFEEDPVSFTVSVPGGEWVLAAAPVGGWASPGLLMVPFHIVALVLSLGISALVLNYLRGRTRTEDSERRARAFLDTTADGVIVIDNDGIVQEFNGGAADMLGYQPDDVIGQSVNCLMFDDEARAHDGHVQAIGSAGIRTIGRLREVTARHKDGTAVPVEVRVSQTTVAGKRLHIGILRDVTVRKKLEQQLREQANTDALTGLMNRRSFLSAARKSLQLAQRHQRPLSILLIDADHFKRINDTHGHGIGDAVLVRLAELVGGIMRETDRLGRIGGEEFAVLLPETAMEGAHLAAERILAVVRAARVDVGADTMVRFSVSIGAATVKPETRTQTLEELMHEADIALYAAKGAGRDRFLHHADAAGPAPAEPQPPR